MSWYEKLGDEVWANFACFLPMNHPGRNVLHYDKKDAAKLIATHYLAAGMKKSEADRLRSKILNCKS